RRREELQLQAVARMRKDKRGQSVADPLTLRSCVGMAETAVLKRPYEDAPVSNLYFEGRKEDFAFEQPAGESPRHQHHVRFWRVDRVDADGRPGWVGSAVYDERVGLSHTTGEVTHVTAAEGRAVASTSGDSRPCRRNSIFAADRQVRGGGLCLPAAPETNLP